MVSCVIALGNRDSTSHEIYFSFVNSSSCCSNYLANTCEFVIICLILLDTFQVSIFQVFQRYHLNDLMSFRSSVNCLG